MAERRIEEEKWQCGCCNKYGYAGYTLDDGSSLCPVCAELLREDTEDVPPMIEASHTGW